MHASKDGKGNPGSDHNLLYIKAELQRIDILLQKNIRLWQLADQNPDDKFRGLYVTGDEATALVGRNLSENWGSQVNLAEEEENSLAGAYRQSQEYSQSIRKSAHEQGARLRLHELAAGFGLSPFEHDAFLICLAPALDLRYERLFGYLQDDVTRKAPSVDLILTLLLPPAPDRLQALDFFHDQALLFKFGLLAKIAHPPETSLSALRQDLTVPPEVISWLLGAYHPANEYEDGFRLVIPGENSQTDTPNLNDFDQSSLKEIDRLADQRPIFAFYGADEERKMVAAQQIAKQLGQALLEIKLETLKAAEILDRRTLRLAIRDAILTQTIPYFSGWECWIDPEGILPATILNELAAYTGPIIVSSAGPWRASSESTSRPILWWSFEIPTGVQRLKLWQHYLDMNGSLPTERIEQLANQFSLKSAQIRDAVGSAMNIAFQEKRHVTVEDLFEAARQHSTHHLGDLAVKLQKRYGWGDIVLPTDELAVLKEITTTVRERTLVLDTWGLGKKLVASSGISALFAGPPGTGKTLAAQVIAAELGMDLYKIDLSTVISKYIGETEKNLERIFNQARNSNAILFFDEADAIFGKRSEVKDAHDRYANIEVGYLLQKMESYDGVVFLATNLRSNLDDAFIRRLQFVVSFPFPDKDERINIWQVLFPPDLPREEHIDFDHLADKFELTGGSIRNVIVTAAFQAASDGSPVSNRHLLHGVRRELQKMGRLIDEKELLVTKQGLQR